MPLRRPYYCARSDFFKNRPIFFDFFIREGVFVSTTHLPHSTQGAQSPLPLGATACWPVPLMPTDGTR